MEYKTTEAQRAKSRRYRAAHLEFERARGRDSYWRNREEINKKARLAYAKNPEKHKARDRKHYWKHHDGYFGSKPYHHRDILYRLYVEEGHSLAQIRDLLGTSHVEQIRYWLKKFGISRRKCTCRIILDADGILKVLMIAPKWSEAHKKKMAESNWHKRHPGEASPFWQGGKSFEPYGVEFTERLKCTIRERDDFTCQECGELEAARAHQVHHINYNKKDSRPENLITLCKSCHGKTNFNRKYWEEHLGIIAELNTACLIGT